MASAYLFPAQIRLRGIFPKVSLIASGLVATFASKIFIRFAYITNQAKIGRWSQKAISKARSHVRVVDNVDE
jgi:hypothetical protein